MAFENYELLKGKLHVFKSAKYEKVIKMLDSFKNSRLTRGKVRAILIFKNKFCNFECQTGNGLIWIG